MDRAENFHSCMQELINTFGATMNETTAVAYRKALWDLDPAKLRKATDRALMESLHMPRPAQLRIWARDVVSASGPQRFLCHFHGDGLYCGGTGRPDQPSTNPTMWWCDRCDYFVRMRMQDPDDRPQNTPTVGQVVRRISDRQEQP